MEGYCSSVTNTFMYCIFFYASLSGDTLQDEQLAYARKQYINWLNKVITEDSMKFYRRSTESELHTNGAKLDRLQGLLKDKPRKHSLRNPGMVLKVTVCVHLDEIHYTKKKKKY